ncbi:MAG: MarR family transcriptional regulator [Myxococcales bacterium]|nr:MAG: MarR family transcriptional regulator [Myxococcales bacterium]
MTRRREAPARGTRLEEQLCFALYSASRAFTRAYQPLLEPLGLTYPQYLVMLVLWEGKSLTVSALGTRVGLDSGTLTPLLKRLEHAKLVKRRRGAEDERVVIVSLSAAGQALKARAATVPVELAYRAGFDIDSARPTQVEQLRESLGELTRRIAPRKAGPAGPSGVTRRRWAAETSR